MMESMQTPTNRADFERGFHLLCEQIHQGNFHVAPGITLGLDKVRFLPNGRIDFLSVNESARLQANMTSHFDTKKIKGMVDQQEIQDTPGNSTSESTLDEPPQ